MLLILPEGLIREIFSHATQEYPVEACGFLFGTRNGEWTVKGLRRATNILKSPSLFEIPPEEIYQAWMAAEDKNLEIVGVYHSHPFASPYPSGRDLEFMRNSDFIWVICGRDELKAYYWKGRILEVEVEVREMEWELI